MRSPRAPGRLGVIRLEQLYARDGQLGSDSSIANWYAAVAAQVGQLAILAPVVPDTYARADRVRFVLRREDRLFALPSVVGYARAFLLAPLIAFRLVQLRLWCRDVIARVPEHANLLVLPLLRVLGFRVVLWLVADRCASERADVERRGMTARARFGRFLSRLTGRVEARALARSRVVANGSGLATFSLACGTPSCRLLPVASTGLRDADLESLPERIPSSDVRVLFVGRVHPEKGLDDLVEALALIRQSPDAPRITLRIIGRDSHGERSRIRQQVRRLGLADIVRFDDPIPYGRALFACYRQADIFVLPSRTEGTPRVVGEAMAAGLPVLATSAGGIPDLMADGVHGRLVPPGRVDVLAAALLDLATHPTVRESMGRAGAAAARELRADSLAARMIAFARARDDGSAVAAQAMEHGS